jgi:hypothetical protein
MSTNPSDIGSAAPVQGDGTVPTVTFAATVAAGPNNHGSTSALVQLLKT